MTLAHPVFSYTKNFFKSYGYTQNLFFHVLPKETPKLQFFSQRLAVFPPIQLFFLSPTYFFHNSYMTWLISFGYLACLCSYLCPLGSAENNSGICRMFRQQIGTWLSAELHTTATVMVGVGSCNGSPVTYGGLPHWVVGIFNNSAFWQNFCLSYLRKKIKKYGKKVRVQPVSSTGKWRDMSSI